MVPKEEFEQMHRRCVAGCIVEVGAERPDVRLNGNPIVQVDYYADELPIPRAAPGSAIIRLPLGDVSLRVEHLTREQARLLLEVGGSKNTNWVGSVEDDPRNPGQ